MEISYINKKSVTEILEKSKKFEWETSISDDNNSLLLKGDNFEGLSFLLQNGYEGKIDLIYIDPPFNTNQEFFTSESRCQSISMSKNGILAYSDKYSLDEYLEFIRERTILMYKLLSDEGSFYFHIDTKMGHYCKLIFDEIFGKENFINDITRIKSNPKNFNRRAYGNEKDVILFYAKKRGNNLWKNITLPLTSEEIKKRYTKNDENGFYTTIPLHAPGETTNGVTGQPWRGMLPPPGRHWRTDPKEFDKLDAQGLIEWSSTGNPRIKKYAAAHKGKKIQDVWSFKDPQYPLYPTQKNEEMLRLIIQQSSDENSIVLDCFAGSGTTLVAAEDLHRKWIGIDSSIESIKTIKDRLKDSNFKEYDLT